MSEEVEEVTAEAAPVEEVTQPDLEAPEAENQESESQEAQEGTKPSIQKRIDELTWQRHEEKRQREAAEQRLQELDREVSQYRQSQQQMEMQRGAPTLEQYGYDNEAWANAYQSYVNNQYTQAQVNQRQMEHQRQQAAQAAQLQARISEKVTKGVEKYPDFQQVVNNPQLPNLPRDNPAAFEAIAMSDHTADIAYYLGKNPSEAFRIAGLAPAQAALEVGRIEAKINTPAKTVTDAPAPPKTINTKSAVNNNPENMSTSEWIKWRNNQVFK